MDVPGPTPVTKPLNVFTVADSRLLLVQVPPPASLRDVVAPRQTVLPPLIAPGIGFTKKPIVVRQPVTAIVYVIVGLPLLTPVTTPVPTPTVACDVLLLVQVPPGVGSLRVELLPTHALVAPAMPNGKGLTVTGIEIVQPVEAV